MPNQPLTYHFGAYTLEPGEHRLLRANDEVALRPKAFETLFFLVSRHGHTVTKDELLDAVWPGTFVSEAVLTHCIAEVRQALQDDAQAPRFLRTIPKVGYAFIAEVQQSSDSTGAGSSSGSFLRSVPAMAPSSAIAVLPFVNLSADPENDYFCDGLSEELINGLTKVPELRVVAHSSSFSFKGRDTDVREIGRQLGVGSVLEGSVRKSGGRLRISAQLIDAAGGFHVWCEQVRPDAGRHLCPAGRDFAVRARGPQGGACEGRAPTRDHAVNREHGGVSPLSPRPFLLASALLGPASEGHGLFRAGHPEGSRVCSCVLAVWRIRSVRWESGRSFRPHDAFPRATAFARRAMEIDRRTRGRARVHGAHTHVLRLGLDTGRTRTGARHRSQRRARR